MSRFYKLKVADIRKTIRDAIVVTLEPEECKSKFQNFTHGQFLTFRHKFDEVEVRRNYSICTGTSDEVIQIGIKRVEGGAFSTWANEELKVGDTMESMLPQGNFNTPINCKSNNHYIGFAGGSGITPVLSILRTILVSEPNSTFTLVYANRNFSTIMFREELEDLKNIHMGRLSIIHILESDSQENNLFTGRIDSNKCEMLFSQLVNMEGIGTAFICGPEPMMLTIAESLRNHGVSEDRIKFELFTKSQVGRRNPTDIRKIDVSENLEVDATILLDGTERSFKMNKTESILEAALKNNIDAPYACKSGVCSTCRAKILVGEIEMLTNHALEDHEIARSQILTCQSYPVSDSVTVDYTR